MPPRSERAHRVAYAAADRATQQHTGGQREVDCQSRRAFPAVSVLVIIGLLLARAFGWLWMDPLAGVVGACVIASWSYGLVRDTGAILLDMVPDRRVADGMRQAVEAEGDTLADLHLWRIGRGHLGAIVSVATTQDAHGPEHYHPVLAPFPNLSHLTVEVRQAA